jgi:tRNA(Ile)-lysidine synthase TilS/MesJ
MWQTIKSHLLKTPVTRAGTRFNIFPSSTVREDNNMRCDKCKNEAIFFQSYSGRHLCGRHLVLDIEARAKRSIRSHRWMHSGDHIAVVVSGDRKSVALLCFLKKLTADRRDIRLSAVPAREGDAATGGASAVTMLAESLGIPCIEMPLPGETGAAANGNVTRIARAISLDDIAQDVLAQFLFGNVERLVHPISGEGTLLPVICPFITIPSDELDIYGEIEGAGNGFPPGTSPRENIPSEITALFQDYYQRHPATKFALLHLAEQLNNGEAALVAAGVAIPKTGDDSSSLPHKKTEQLKNSL